MGDLDRLASDLGAMPAKMTTGVTAAMTASVQRAEAQAKSNASGHKTLPHYAQAISSEMSATATGITATVGVDKGGQGSLGHLIEYGSPTSGAHMHVNQAVDGEVDTFVTALQRVASGLL